MSCPYFRVLGMYNVGTSTLLDDPNQERMGPDYPTGSKYHCSTHKTPRSVDIGTAPRPRYIPYSYVDPLGMVRWRSSYGCHDTLGGMKLAGATAGLRQGQG